ncbi:GTPase, partial [Streptomyces oryzae]|uniref:GTPase n=1 Tax=Streptomyces oryzae TaxID=1434886 RepID=UPI0035563BA9
MTSTDATHTGPGQQPERWTGSLPDGWVSAHSDPVEGQLELSLDGEDAPPPSALSAPSAPGVSAPSQEHAGQSESEGGTAAAQRATADVPRQQSDPAAGSPAAGSPAEDGAEPVWDDGVIARRAPAERITQPAEQPETGPPHPTPAPMAPPQPAQAPQPTPVVPGAEAAPQGSEHAHQQSERAFQQSEHMRQQSEHAPPRTDPEPAPPYMYEPRPQQQPYPQPEPHRAVQQEAVEHAAAPEPEVRAPGPRGHAAEADASERGGDHPVPGIPQAPAPPWRGTPWPTPRQPGPSYSAAQETTQEGRFVAVQEAHSPAVAQGSGVQPESGPGVQEDTGAGQEHIAESAESGPAVRDDTVTDTGRSVDQSPENADQSPEKDASRDLRTDLRRESTRELSRDLRRDPRRDAGENALRHRLGALRELVGLSRTRLDADVLAEAGKVLDEAATRRGLPRSYTTVALAGATGSGKSSLFNALTGGRLSEVGMRRPTTAQPVACTWEAGRYSDGGPEGLLDRLGIPQHARHRTHDGTLSGLILVDLPDHDSVAPGHREQVDRMLELVDAVVWVVDPEKYADALLHEGYLRRLAGHAEVTFVVLNQTDRLTRDAVDAVLDDLRRLLDEDGMALGEHGEPGAAVLSASALTHEGIDVLREELGEFVAQQRAAVLRLTADLDGATERLRPVYADPGPGAEDGPIGLTESAREDFEDRLAVAVGAAAAGQAAERAWLRQAEHSSGIPWVRALRWYASRPTQERDDPSRTAAGEQPAEQPGERDGAAVGTAARRETLQQPLAARPVVAQAVRELADAAASGLPGAWARTVRESARRGAAGLPEVLDEVMAVCASGPDAVRTASAAVTASMTDVALGTEPASSAQDAAARAVPGQQAYAEAPGRGSGTGATGASGASGGTGSGTDDGREERTGAAGEFGREAREGGGGTTAGRSPGSAAGPAADAEGTARRAGGGRSGAATRVPRPTWHTAAFAGQWLLFGVQMLGAVWAVAALALARGLDQAMLLPCVLLTAATVAGPALAWACRRAARGPARTYGLEEERRLRQLAACCGRTRVLEPVAAELLRYRQVREQYAIAAGAVDSALATPPVQATPPPAQAADATGAGQETEAGKAAAMETAAVEMTGPEAGGGS